MQQGKEIKLLREETTKELLSYCTISALIALKAEILLEKSKAKIKHSNFQKDLDDMKVSI